jgi:hypothetical protein
MQQGGKNYNKIHEMFPRARFFKNCSLFPKELYINFIDA